jgi:hypothetical protein
MYYEQRPRIAPIRESFQPGHPCKRLSSFRYVCSVSQSVTHYFRGLTTNKLLRYDPPTSSAPSLTYATALSASNFLGLISHAFNIACFPSPPAVSIRLLAPSESPNSQLFIASDYVKGTPGEDQLAEASANLISQIGRLKRTGMGWEDKAGFLHYHNEKQK